MTAPRAHPSPLLGFMFHEVTDDPRSTGYQRVGARPYVCGIADFTGDLDAIGASGHTPALLDAHDPSVLTPRVLLTFDDGGRSALRAGDLLMSRGWRGHFFIVTGRLGTRGFLDRREVRYLRSCGHLVGSHSHTHPDIFPALTRDAMHAEWATSRAILEQTLGEPCTLASLPGGDLSTEVCATARAAGFAALFTSEPWLHPHRRGGCLLVGRYAVKAGMRLRTLTALLHLRGWERALVRRRCSVLARRGLAPLYRLYVRHTTAADRAPEPMP